MHTCHVSRTHMNEGYRYDEWVDGMVEFVAKIRISHRNRCFSVPIKKRLRRAQVARTVRCPPTLRTLANAVERKHPT